jgi:hypothetical protein
MKTVGILKKYSFKGSSEIEAFEKFVDAVERAKQLEDEGEEALGEVPDHFLGNTPQKKWLLIFRSFDVHDYGGSGYFTYEQGFS